MIGKILTAILCVYVAVLLAATVAQAIGYTVFVREQVIPMYTQVGDLQVLNPGETPDYPTTFRTKICYSQPFSIYSTAENRRTEVWEDYEGTATDQQIQAACPLWNFSNSSSP